MSDIVIYEDGEVECAKFAHSIQQQFFYVPLSSFYFKYSLNWYLEAPVYVDFESVSSVLFVSKRVENGLKGNE
jgi:hypothetical protein